MGKYDEYNQKKLDSIVRYEHSSISKYDDLSGQTIGLLHVDKFVGYDGSNTGYYMCTCKCGNKKVIRELSLIHNNTQSCGCLHTEMVRNLGLQNKGKGIHGDSLTRLYQLWQRMRYRCNNPSTSEYEIYGGRGIRVCPEWDNLENGYVNFRTWAYENGYNDNLTIDRIDADKDYCPENCRFADMKLQGNNRRTNIYLQCGPYVFSMAIWAEITGLGYDTIRSRYRYGWTESEIILTPKYATNREKSSLLYVPPEYDKYNKYNEFCEKRLIKRDPNYNT